MRRASGSSAGYYQHTLQPLELFLAIAMNCLVSLFDLSSKTYLSYITLLIFLLSSFIIDYLFVRTLIDEEMAVDVGERLLPAFDTPTGI